MGSKGTNGEYRAMETLRDGWVVVKDCRLIEGTEPNTFATQAEAQSRAGELNGVTLTSDRSTCRDCGHDTFRGRQTGLWTHTSCGCQHAAAEIEKEAEMTDTPEYGKQYRLTSAPGTPSIMQGNSWAESEVGGEHATVPQPLRMGMKEGLCPTCAQAVWNDHGIWKHREISA